MQTVVETPGYLKAAERLFSEAERSAFVTEVAERPEAGDLIPGTGGFRKLRVARGGTGKRGGARLIYLFRGEELPVFLITVYAKNEKSNVSQKERNELMKRADQIFSSYRREQ